MDRKQMWSVLLKEAQRCERSRSFEDCTDLSSELMMYYLGNLDKAEKTFKALEKGNVKFLFIDMKNVAREQRKKKLNFEITVDMQTFVKMRQIADQYEIALTEDNAYKFHKLLEEIASLPFKRDVFKIASIIALYNNSENRNTDIFKDVLSM